MSKFATRAFDIRNVIGGLLGLYGLILLASFGFLDPGIDASTANLKTTSTTSTPVSPWWLWQ